MTDTAYMLGHSREEIRRLMLQATVIRPTTERLLRNTGIGWGMRVLDLGCGAGDVSMQAAEIVGPAGSVVGIDRSADALAIAEQRARSAKLQQVKFVQASVASFSDTASFDLVIGRYVLIHQPDPAVFIRDAARHVRCKGVLAFHEVDLLGKLRSAPHVPLWERTGDWILSAFHNVLPHYDAANRLLEHFSNAELPHPDLFAEVPVGGGEDSLLYAWMTDTMRSVLPQLTEMGLATAATTDIETLERRLRKAVTQARSQIFCPMQICAWTRL